MPETATRDLVSDALNVMNRSLSKNEDSFPYKQIIDLTRRTLDGKKVGIAVYRDDAGNPHDYYTAVFKEGRIVLLDRGKENVTIQWKVSEKYLKKVADDPDPYIDHPEKLDWEWLKDRVGI